MLANLARTANLAKVAKFHQRCKADKILSKLYKKLSVNTYDMTGRAPES